jgi:arginine-tRNA-protein transferase
VARVLQQIVEEPRACAYLPDESASLEVRVMVDVTAAELEAMLARGWRRFGPCYFRPACSACGECVTLRVVVDRFSPSKSQRRAAKNAAHLRRVVKKPIVDDARLALYAKWHADREHAREWPASEQTVERYALDFAFPHPAAREVAFYDDDAGGKLVGVGLNDETPRATSAAFFFYDPDYARESLGVANVVALIDDARRRGVPHVYLGYRVMGCASLKYKASYRPHELLVGRPGRDEEPRWTRAE